MSQKYGERLLRCKMYKKFIKEIIVYILLVFSFLFLYLYCADKYTELTMSFFYIVGVVTVTLHIGKFTDWLFDDKEDKR